MRQESCDNPPRDNPGSNGGDRNEREREGGGWRRTRPFLGENYSFSIENFLSSFPILFFLFKRAVKLGSSLVSRNEDK